MKTNTFLVMVLCFILSIKSAKGQTVEVHPSISANGTFDKVSDQYGNTYPLINLSLKSKKPFSQEVFTVTVPPTNSCSAGYFDLYFEPGSLFDVNASAASVLCEVYRNISGFINSPLAAPGNTVRINIYCANVPASAGPVGGLAGLLFAYPYNYANPNAGIIDSQVQRALLTGQDPYANLPLAAFPASGGFYSGYIYANPFFPWNYNLATTTILSSELDFYTTMLHETTHSMGFSSLIDFNGISRLGSANNYFTRYDQFLRNAAGTPLLGGAPAGCSNSNLSFQTSTTSINPLCPGGNGTDLTNCTAAVIYSSALVPNVKVYTPDCFEPGSSLSHFEDMCSFGSFTTICTPTPTAPGYNNLYYAMSNSNSFGSCYVKRHLTEEERHVLCDLNYSVNTTYTSNAAGASYTYTGGSCSGTGVWGMHDGFSNGIFTFTTTGTTISIPTASLLLNDSPNSVSVTCEQLVTNNGVLSISGGSLTITSLIGSGLVIAKYIPKNISGQPGNATYVYFYFLQTGCGSDPCNLVQNGGFESLAPASTYTCGESLLGNYFKTVPGCWLSEGSGTPDLFNRYCSDPGFNLSGVTDTYNGIPNNYVTGLGCANSSEIIKNNLGSSLIPGETYQFSAWLYAAPGNPTPTSSLVVTICADINIMNVVSNVNYTNELPVIAEFTVGPTGAWSQFTNTFVFSPTLAIPHNALVLGMDFNKTTILNGGGFSYCYFDDIRLTALTGTAACCPLSNTNYTSSVLSGSITGSRQFTTNIAVPTGSIATLSGDFKFGPSVQITVNSGASLVIHDSHLYSCSGRMWTGIVVNDGGNVILDHEFYDNLLEDALTAVDISGHTTSTLTSILFANRTTFNKNLVGIKVSNYIRSSSTYPFSIKNCVFTSRDFTYTPTVWAQTSSTLASGLRYAASGATLNVSSPYLLQSAPVASLLVPYSGNTSKTGIQLTNVGLTSGSNFYGIAIGFTDTPQSFNLFDSQNEGILAENTNLYCLNAVFQETREYGSMGLFWMQYEPGAGIRHRVTSLMNTKLGLSAPNTDFGNRFWNCHTGINATNPYRFELENAIMRSTQVNTFVPINPPPALQPPNALGGYGQGGFGILMGTNRINSYIRYNEFTNLNTGISISAIAGTYTVGTSTPQNGIYGYKLAIVQNSFSPLLPSSTATTIGTSYMSRAISIDSPNGALWNVGTDPTDPGSIGIIIGSNSIKRVYDGVILNGISSAFRNTVDKNTITLDDDNIFNTVQRGITVENVAGMHTSSSNTLSSVGTGTSAQTSLVYCIQNGGLASPLVICNTLSNAYQGFEFSSNNLTSKWRGNEMSNLQRGLLLSYSSQMGQQGTNSQSCQNKWLGSTWSSPNFATYLITSSNASFSPMYIKPGNTTPPNNSGSVINSQWYIPSVSIFTASGGDYSCVSSPNSIPVPVVSPGSFDNDTYFYIAATNLYRTLALNDSIRLSSSTYTAFYNSLSGSSIDLFWKAEQELYDNDHSTASSYLSSITTTNSVEYNYKTYYTVYANYLGNGNTMSQNDSADLFTLALMCPGKDGACIHQARALYNAVYKFPQRYNDNCEGGERKANITNSITSNLKWDVRLFPNPAENRITINTPIKTEILNIKISDVSGRLVLTQNVKTEDFIANLDLGLLNGAYLVTITNKNNETTTKKLLIAK